jgi:hypothetical protein
VRALDGLDLRVPGGTVFGLLGPNGAGKTTLVRVLATLLEPTAGRAEVLGHDVVREPLAVRRQIGLAGQFAAVDAELTGRETSRWSHACTDFPAPRRAGARARCWSASGSPAWLTVARRPTPEGCADESSWPRRPAGRPTPRPEGRMTSASIAVPRRGRITVVETLADTRVMAARQLRKVLRRPMYVVYLFVQPVIFVLLFRYVFGRCEAGYR